MAVSTSTYQPMTIYQRDIDQWIIAAYRAGAQDFWRLVSMLPAVYPTVVRQAVERLIAMSVIPADLAVERSTWDSSGVSGAEVPGLPTPNPLASDWRYTRGTAGELLERVITSTDPTQTVALLGSPSVHKMAAIREAPRGLAGKPLAGFCTTPSRRITVVYGVIVYAIRFKTPSLHR